MSAASVPGAEQAPSVKTILERCNELAPRLRERAAATELKRSLPDETFADLKTAGLLKIFKPHRYGGYEMDWGPQLRAGRTIARSCPSTAWIVTVVGSHAAYVCRLRPEAQDDIWQSGEDVLIATGSVPVKAGARAVDGGYILDGQWRFCSGVDHAAWAMTPTFVEDQRELGMRYFLYPRADFSIDDDWHVAGMSGTGSKSVVVSEVFVPEHRTLPFVEFFVPDPPGSKVNAGGVYSYDFRLFVGSAMLGPIVGTAEGALEQMLALARDDTGVQKMNIHDTATQLLIAESSAEVETAGYLLDRILERQSYYPPKKIAIPVDERVALLRDRTFATRLCVNAIERLVTSLDSRSIFDDDPIQRQFRDLAAMAQQIGVNWDRNMSSCGQKLLGLPSEDTFLNPE